MPLRADTREQIYLLPPSLEDWVPSDHPIRLVAWFVDAIDATTWQQMGIDLAGAREGAPGYDPRLLASVWLGGFVLGIRSTRELEAACRDQVSFRWLTGNQVPDHNTLHRFYQQHRTGMRALLTRSVAVAWRAGLIDLALLAVDGTKVAGNAARARTYDIATLTQLLERTEQAIDELEATNAAQTDDPLPRLPAELAQATALRARIQAAMAQVEAEQGPRQANVTDPDATLHKTRHGYVAGYNAQAAAVRVRLGSDVPSSLLITAAEVTTERDDHRQLVPMLDASTAVLGSAPAVVAADGGYHSGVTLAACAAREQTVVMPETQATVATADAYHVQHFLYDATTDTYTCPQQHVLTFRTARQRAGRPPVRIYRGDAAVCQECPAFGRCTINARQGRSLEVTAQQDALTQHRRWMQTPVAQRLAAHRKTLIEPVFGILKEQQRLRRFLLRGWTNVAAEWSLLATAFNLRALVRAWRCGALSIAPIGPGAGPPDGPRPGDPPRRPCRSGLQTWLPTMVSPLTSRQFRLISPF